MSRCRDQRTALVANAEAQCGDKARGDKRFHKSKDGRRGKFAKGKDGRRGKFAKGKDGRRGKFAKGKHATFLKGLNLTEEQEAQLREARADMKGDRPERKAMKSKWTAMRDKKKAMFAAFATDDFDATTYAKADMSEHIAAKLDKKVEMMRTLVSILDAEQRATLADSIEEGPKMSKRGHKKGMKRDRGRRGARR